MTALRVALLSAWHVHAVDYLREARALDGIEVVAFWDDDAERGAAFAREHDLPLEPDLDAIFARDDVDAVICTTATRDHRDVLTRAAEAGKHIFTEKVLAASRAEADAILAAVDAAGVELMGSLPRLTGSAYRTTQRALDEGRLGTVSLARCRVAHDGAVARDGNPGWLPARFLDPGPAQGGALIDLGAHPIYLLARLLGRPSAVTARFASATEAARRTGVDDTAVVVAEFGDPGGPLGIIETGFASVPHGMRLELHGTEAVLEADDASVRLLPRGGDPVELESVPPDRSPMAQWRDRIARGVDPTVTRDDLRVLTEVNEAAARSARDGIRVHLP